MILLLAGILIEIGFVILLSLGNLRENVIPFIYVFFGIFTVYLIIIAVLNRKKTETRYSLLIIILFAVLFRSTMIFSPPTLSDDIFRYLWDGKVIHDGINPYKYAPAADELNHLNDVWYFPLINHKQIKEIYPPFTELIFYISHLIRPGGVKTLKSLFTLFDLLTLGMILLLLKELKRPLWYSIIYAWNPLIAVEIAGSGHCDSLPVFLVLLSLWLLLKKKHALSYLVLGLSFLSKYFSLILLPLLIKKTKKHYWILFFLPAILMFLPCHPLDNNIFDGLIKYSKHWQFNSSVYYLLHSIINNDKIAKTLLALVFLTISLRITRKETDILKGSFLIIGTLLVLTTTFYPWYIIWIIPFLCFFRNRAWLLLTGLITLSYLVLVTFNTTGKWELSKHFMLLEYIPFYSLLIYDFLKGRKTSISN